MKIKHIIIPSNKVCRKCNMPTEIRKRNFPPKEKNFYYKQWEFCRKCNAVYFDENDKSNDWSEYEEQQNHFKFI